VVKRASAATVFLLLVLASSGCESTQDKSARLAREGKGVKLDTTGTVVRKQTSRVRVLSTAVIQDENGTAAVVSMRNTGGRPLARLPVSIDVRGRNGKSLFRNDAPGLEPALAGVTLLGPSERLLWVNDQAEAAAKPRRVSAKVGDPREKAPRRVPRISISRVRLVEDAVSGTAAEGFATNRSRIEQRKLVVFAVARKGRRIVAAGRAQINRLKPGKRAHFQAFFTGNPKGGRLELAAPPTRF
jgi:hypothetical protein